MRPEVKIPTPVFPGDTIGIIAPAGSFDKATFDRGVERLGEAGFDVYAPPEIFAEGIPSPANEMRKAELITRMFEDSSIKAVMCAKGGFGSMKVLPWLDFETFSTNPKPLIGFSDISALLNNVLLRSSIAVFHGPVVTSLAQTDPETIDGLRRALSFEEDLIFEPKDFTTIFPGRIEAPLAGGNLTTLCHLLGTPWQPDFSGHILFFEDVNEEIYKIDRMLHQMRFAGVFDGIAGMILGGFDNCGGVERIHALARTVLKNNDTGSPDIPILAGMESGHGERNLTFPLGCIALLDADSGRVEISAAGRARRSDNP